MLRERRFQIDRRVIQRRAYAQRHGVLANVRGIDIYQAESRAIIQDNIAQDEIAIFVIGQTGDTRPGFARRKLQQRHIQRAGGAWIQVDRNVLSNEIVRRIANDDSNVLQARPFRKHSW